MRSCSSPVGRRPPRWRGSNGTPLAASGRGSRSAGCGLRRGWRSARRRHGPERSRTDERPRDRPRRSRARRAGRPARPDVRCRDRRHAGPAGPPPRSRRDDLALRRGSLRLGPPAVRAGGRSMAPGADRVRGGGADPDPAWAGTPWSVRGCDWSSGRRARAGSVVDVTPGLRRDPVPDLDAVGQDEALVGADPRRDRARRPDHLRPVHGAGAVRPGWRLLPVRGRASGSRR